VQDVNRLAKTKGFNFYSVYIPVGRRMHRKVYLVTGSDIKTHVIVIASELSEICRQADGYGKRIPEFRFRITDRLEKLRPGSRATAEQ
jgi:hypothetical protein